MGFSSRRAPVPGDWTIRYQVPAMSAPLAEIFATKQEARERLKVVMRFKGLAMLELRDPAGRVWFKDHFFTKGSPP